MQHKIFISDQYHFSLQIPCDWKKYDDGYEEEGSYVFYDPTNEISNLRITAVPFQLISNFSGPEEYMEGLYRRNSSNKARKIKIENFYCVSFADQTSENDESIVYYWYVQKGDFIYIFSFTIEKKMEMAEVIRQELEKIDQIIMTIKIRVK